MTSITRLTSLSQAALLFPSHPSRFLANARLVESPYERSQVVDDRYAVRIVPSVTCASTSKIDYDGVPILKLDIEGMLITKNTTRESDRADRLKLQRLKLALAEAAKSDKPDSPTSKRKSNPVRRKDKR